MNQALLEELLSMQARDQACRAPLALKAITGAAVTREEARQLEFVDCVNTYRMQEITAQYGWPGRSLVGDEAGAAVLLLVLHADHNVAFQKQCLEMLCTAVSQGEAPAKDLAFLTDRILVDEGRPQRYGTQWKIVNGRHFLAAVADAMQVDARRAALGLAPLSLPESSALPSAAVE